jgi:hypothetical protein
LTTYNVTGYAQSVALPPYNATFPGNEAAAIASTSSGGISRVAESPSIHSADRLSVAKIAHNVAMVIRIVAKCLFHVAKFATIETACDDVWRAMTFIATLCDISATFRRDRNAIDGCRTRLAMGSVAKCAYNEGEV